MVPTTWWGDNWVKSVCLWGLYVFWGEGSTRGLREIWGVYGLRGRIGDSEGWILGWIEGMDSLAHPVACRHLTKCKYTPIYCQNVQKVRTYVLLTFRFLNNSEMSRHSSRCKPNKSAVDISAAWICSRITGVIVWYHFDIILISVIVSFWYYHFDIIVSVLLLFIQGKKVTKQ